MKQATKNNSPEALVRAFFAPGGIQDKQAVYTEELKARYLQEKTLGELLPPKTKLTLHPLPPSGDRQVYAVDLLFPGQTRNWYIHLKREAGTWKLAAIRTLALPNFLLQVTDTLKKKQRTQQEEGEYQNLLLVQKTDSELKDFIRQHQVALEQVATLIRSNRATEATMEAKKLFLTSANKQAQNSRTVEIVFGGVTDNTVGVLSVPTGSKPPEMHPSSYIYIELVTSSLYLFKTT